MDLVFADAPDPLEVAGLVASAIHAQGQALCPTENPCFVCRREARGVLAALEAAGLRIVRIAASQPAVNL